MEHKVIWTLPAVEEVREIRDYIAKDSPRYAFAFLKNIFQVSRSLKTFPERGRKVAQVGDPTIREIFYKRRRIVYRVSPKVVEIESVIDMSRDFMTAWNQ